MQFSKLLFWGTIFCALAFSFVACSQTEKANNAEPKTTEITVSAAASLQDAFREIGELYQKQTGIKVNFNFASSGVLQKQIEQGAPADVFASAGQEQMDALAEKNLIVSETRQNFIGNELVLIEHQRTDIPGWEMKEYLLEIDPPKIAIGNPKTVPAGLYAEQTLRNLGLWGKFENRLVFAEDVRQVLQYVELNEINSGIVYASDAKAAENKVYIVTHASADSHNPILYPIVVVKNSPNQDAARKFINVTLSADGQQILKKYGFITVNG